MKQTKRSQKATHDFWFCNAFQTDDVNALVFFFFFIYCWFFFRFRDIFFLLLHIVRFNRSGSDQAWVWKIKMNSAFQRIPFITVTPWFNKGGQLENYLLSNRARYILESFKNQKHLLKTAFYIYLGYLCLFYYSILKYLSVISMQKHEKNHQICSQHCR